MAPDDRDGELPPISAVRNGPKPAMGDAGMPPTPLREGEVVAGRCRVVRSLGAGGMGEVYLAEQLSLRSRQVALKVLAASSAGDLRMRARFVLEPEVQNAVKSPYVVPVIDCGETADGRPFFVMDFVDGLRLDQAAERCENMEERIHLLLKVCDGVERAHQKGLANRDLKPANVPVDCEGTPRIVDFGIAKFAGPAVRGGGLSLTRERLGTIGYMSPEQLSGKDMDFRTDVYSLGVVLFKLLTGAPPHRDSTGTSGLLAQESQLPRRPRELRGDVPRRLEPVMMKALLPDRNHRYQTVAAFSADLRCFLEGRPTAVGSDLVYRAIYALRRHRALISVATAAVAVGCRALRQFVPQDTQGADAREGPEDPGGGQSGLRPSDL